MTAGGAYTLKYSTIKKLPIIIASSDKISEIKNLVEKIIEDVEKISQKIL